MKKRYQIFISSTFADLKEERKLVMQAVLERKSFPAGMELFPAKEKRQFEYIKQVIDDSDYYLLIIGARYGSLDDDQVSFTEKEYDYAVSKGIPVIAFLPSNDSINNQVDVDEIKQAKLKAFKEKVKTGRLVNFWENAHDLKAKVISSLVDAFEDQDYPRTGWVRADTVVSGDAKKEIDKLQNKIKTLESQVYAERQSFKEVENSYHEAQSKIKNLEAELAKMLNIISSPSRHFDILSSKDLSFDVKNVKFKMIRIEGGTFMMGATEVQNGQAFDDEYPVHKVELTEYYIGETQVTQALWEAFMGPKNNQSSFKGFNRPVENVTWDACQEFIQKLNGWTGLEFSLPTEAQWEFAARGGNAGKDKDFRYAGSNDIYDVAQFIGNFKNETCPVGEMKPNELGLYDMSGNVWEWCEDWYGYYSDKTEKDPKGPDIGPFRVQRGGSWHSRAAGCRVSLRKNFNPTSTIGTIGFRLALKFNSDNK